MNVSQLWSKCSCSLFLMTTSNARREKMRSVSFTKGLVCDTATLEHGCIWLRFFHAPVGESVNYIQSFRGSLVQKFIAIAASAVFIRTPCCIMVYRRFFIDAASTWRREIACVLLTLILKTANRCTFRWNVRKFLHCCTTVFRHYVKIYGLYKQSLGRS